MIIKLYDSKKRFLKTFTIDTKRDVIIDIPNVKYMSCYINDMNRFMSKWKTTEDLNKRKQKYNKLKKTQKKLIYNYLDTELKGLVQPFDNVENFVNIDNNLMYLLIVLIILIILIGYKLII